MRAYSFCRRSTLEIRNLTTESIGSLARLVRFLESCLFQFCKDQEAKVDQSKTVEDLSITTSILVFFIKQF